MFRNNIFDTLACPHCGVMVSVPGDIFSASAFALNDRQGDDGAKVQGGHCPNCGGVILKLIKGKLIQGQDRFNPHLHVDEKILLYPSQALPPAVSQHVPEKIAQLYSEAYQVLPISPSASAALSRRLLQHIFHDCLGIKARDLNAEVDLFMARIDVSKPLADSVDHVRVLGNFAAHPIKNIHSGEIIEVEEGEAEESLMVLEEVIEFAFILPAKKQERHARLNEKLRESNKPELKKRST